jgi:hypothetical protein
MGGRVAQAVDLRPLLADLPKGWLLAPPRRLFNGVG